MKANFVDCFMLMGTALSLRGDQGLPAMGRPILRDIFTTNVNISLTLTNIRFINIKNMEVELTFLLHQRWIDPRLGANINTRKLAVNGQIWRPWITAIAGEIKTIENEMSQFWRGFGSEGNILYSENVILKTVCTSNFRNFPFDIQKCFIELGSYRFPVEEVELFWNIKPIDVKFVNNLNEFDLINILTYSEIDVRPSGNFTVLIVEITFKRNYEHYIFCVMLPCLLTTFISYFNFWFNFEKLNMRYGLLTISLCILLYFYHFSVCLTQSVSYLKALDIFISICIAFNLLELLENFIIDLCMREKLNSRNFHQTKSYCSKKLQFVDRSVGIIIAVLFICILFFYFVIYL